MKDLKGYTSSLLMPELLLDLWSTCGGYVTPKHIILGPRDHAPLTFLSLKEAHDIAGQLMPRANHKFFKNPGEVCEEEVVAVQMVKYIQPCFFT
jgi:hypothetical protein